MDQDAICYGGGLRPGHIVLHGDPAPPQKKKAQQSPILAHVYCGQTAGWIKMKSGMEIGLGPDHIVLDGDPVPLPEWTQLPLIFGPCLLWQKQLD